MKDLVKNVTKASRGGGGVVFEILPSRDLWMIPKVMLKNQIFAFDNICVKKSRFSDTIHNFRLIFFCDTLHFPMSCETSYTFHTDVNYSQKHMKTLSN